jgi:membrane-bound lytic murein transglycosylase B
MWKQAMAALLSLMMLGCASMQRASDASTADAAAQAEAKADPKMEAAYAYGRELHDAAQSGLISKSEADALAQARVDEVKQQRQAEEEFHHSMNERYEPEDVYK